MDGDHLWATWGCDYSRLLHEAFLGRIQALVLGAAALSRRRDEVLCVGQKVVCVRDSRWPPCESYVPTLPKKGFIYTIRAIVPCKALGFNEDGMLLEEIVNPVRLLYSPRLGFAEGELKFRISRFRPVRTTARCAPQGEREGAREKREPDWYLR
jgi:hypothetical protein